MMDQPGRPSAPTEVLALGEVMVRLSPPAAGRLEFARSLEVDVGGGEYNVAYALARFGHTSGFITRLPDHPLSRLVINHARAVGLDTRHINLVPYDGVGRTDRLGLYFAEVGAGVRGGMAVFDRGHAAAAGFQPTDLDWPEAFAHGCRHFHASGIFPLLAPNCAETLSAALSAARAAGVTISYDLNYRASLSPPGMAAAINHRMVASADVLIGSDEGFAWLLARGDEPVSQPRSELLKALGQRYPNLKSIAGTVRTVRSGSRHDLTGFVWQGGVLTEDAGFADFEIVDRVGTGDAFSAGLLHGFLRGWAVARSLRFALAHAVLVHTLRGDTSQFSEADVAEVAGGGGTVMRR